MQTTLLDKMVPSICDIWALKQNLSLSENAESLYGQRMASYEVPQRFKLFNC